MNQKTPETLTWKALRYQDHSRSASWYLGLAVAAVGLIGFSIYEKSIITAITFGLIILVLFVISTQRPRQTTYHITRTGIAIGQTVYPYKVIKNFWINYNPPEVKTLNFETTAYLNRIITAELDNENPLLVKQVLSQYLPEDLDREESVTETLARKLKI